MARPKKVKVDVSTSAGIVKEAIRIIEGGSASDKPLVAAESLREPLSTTPQSSISAIRHLEKRLEIADAKNERLTEKLKNAEQKIIEITMPKGIPDAAAAKTVTKTPDEVRKEALISSIGKSPKEYSDVEKEAVEREIRRYISRDGGKKIKLRDKEGRETGEELTIPYYRDGLTIAEKERAVELCKRAGKDIEKPTWDLTINLPM